jgi:adenylate cyclase
VERRLAAILAADVVGYSKLMAEDEAGTLVALKAHRKELFDPEIEKRGGRVVKLMGDGALVEFASVVDAVESALAIQRILVEGDGPFTLRIGINLGDVIIDGDDIYGDGVNIAARLEKLAEPGGICLSSVVFESLGNRVDAVFADAGEHAVKNIDKPIRVWKWPDRSAAATGVDPAPSIEANAPVLPEKPSIAVLPLNNMSNDPDQDFLADGIAEDIITSLSKFGSLFVIARNSSFSFKGQQLEVKKIGKRLGVRYVLEGSVRRAGNRARITAQLIDAIEDQHIWAHPKTSTPGRTSNAACGICSNTAPRSVKRPIHSSSVLLCLIRILQPHMHALATPTACAYCMTSPPTLPKTLNWPWKRAAKLLAWMKTRPMPI